MAMTINLTQIKLRDLFDGYVNSDEDGVMGVPVTFLGKFNPEQFEVVGLDRYVEDNPHYGHRFKVNGKETYARILIRRKAGVNNG